MISDDNKIICINESHSNLICQVCGAKKAQIHYGGLSCSSCKMFFRRNFRYDLTIQQCEFDNQCDITIDSRRICRYCRLKKCFSIGMQRELLRAAHRQRIKTKNLHSNDLLENNRSLLTTEQWSYLSNIINTYDEISPLINIRNIIKQELTYPIKIRQKMALNNMFIIMSSIYETILPFLERIPHFQNLSYDDKSELIERNIKTTGGYNGTLACRDADFCSSFAFKIGFSSVYGPYMTEYALRINNQTDNDSTLIKLLIPTLLFSTGSLLCVSVNNQEIRMYFFKLNIKLKKIFFLRI